MMFSTQRKFWGWGVESFALPPPLLDLARAFLSARLGRPLPEARPIPTLASIQIPDAKPIPTELASFATNERFDRAAHTYGKAFRDVVRALDGDFSIAPDFVAYPKDEDDIAHVLRIATREHIAVIPFGGGSSVVGGIEPDAALRDQFSAVLSLDLCCMDRVLEVDSVSCAARIQAGVYGPSLEKQLRPFGVTLRHYPQSFEFSTLGGWIATRAGGHFATLYTHIDDLVESLRMVTPCGVVQTRRLPGNGAGPEQNRLLLGSEGAFGVLSEAWVRVQRLPKHRAHCTVRFPSFSSGVGACRALAQSGLFPANARLVERDEAFFMGAGDGESDVLLLGFESADFSQEDKLKQAVSIAQHAGGTAGRLTIRCDSQDPGNTYDEAADLWKQSFLRAPYLRDELIRMGLIAETFETCTTWDRFSTLDAAVRAAAQTALQRACGGGLLTCRFTHLYPDGPAPYYTVIALPPPGRLLSAWDSVKCAVSQAIVDQGATITHHHAVGKHHREHFIKQTDPAALAILAAVKHAVDPTHIMNPGTLLPEPKT